MTFETVVNLSKMASTLGIELQELLERMGIDQRKETQTRLIVVANAAGPGQPVTQQVHWDLASYFVEVKPTAEPRRIRRGGGGATID